MYDVIMISAFVDPTIINIIKPRPLVGLGGILYCKQTLVETFYQDKSYFMLHNINLTDEGKLARNQSSLYIFDQKQIQIVKKNSDSYTIFILKFVFCLWSMY